MKSCFSREYETMYAADASWQQKLWEERQKEDRAHQALREQLHNMRETIDIMSTYPHRWRTIVNSSWRRSKYGLGVLQLEVGDHGLEERLYMLGWGIEIPATSYHVIDAMLNGSIKFKKKIDICGDFQDQDVRIARIHWRTVSEWVLLVMVDAMKSYDIHCSMIYDVRIVDDRCKISVGESKFRWD